MQQQEGTAAPVEPMPAPETQAAEPGQTFTATGTVTAVDATAGRVTIDHGAVPEANMPAGTMEFALQDSSAAQQLQQGQPVQFSFMTDAAGQATISEITPTEQKPTS